MQKNNSEIRTSAQESRNAIERLYITMRHLFNRGFYKPMGVSGETLREALLQLRPEIYGSIADEELELDGLMYVLDRLPIGIEECSVINLTSDEGLKNTSLEVIIPAKRRRMCYRIDEAQMNIEITRGRSEIYDILTHLTFLFMESHKIAKRVLTSEKGSTIRDWTKLEEATLKSELNEEEKEVALIYLANVISRPFEEVKVAFEKFGTAEDPNRFIKIIYGLGKLAIEEIVHENKRVITFSSVLRNRLGHHIYGEVWANNIQNELDKLNLINRPIHVISANMHSVMNYLYADAAVGSEIKANSDMEMFEVLSDSHNKYGLKITEYASKNGFKPLLDTSGTNIHVQLIDTAKINFSKSPFKTSHQSDAEAPVLIVMDYAFGEQAYEVIDELLKSFKDEEGTKKSLNICSLSIMGKAGILEGGKGDLMIPTAHVFEGTADNYPFENELSLADFEEEEEEEEINAIEGTMITVLGTSLQNKEVLKYFKNSTWKVVGLEMEGAHYQKAIQSASKIRKSIREDVKVRYAYYASDNPLLTGHTLASGGLGLTGVKPTYIITKKILEQILSE